MNPKMDAPNIQAGLSDLGTPSSTVITEQLIIFLNELSRWNRTYNLTRIPETNWVPQIVFQSAALQTLADSCPMPGDWMDMGTGPGIPGLILAILEPDRKIRLVDSRSKKTDFIVHICRILDLRNVDILTARLEKLPMKRPELKKQCSAIFARALGSIPDLIQWGSPFLKPAGRFFLPRGGTVEQEWLQFKEGTGKTWDGDIVRIALPGPQPALNCLMVFRKEEYS